MSDDFTRCRMMWLEQVFADKDMTSTMKEIAFHLSWHFNRKHFTSVGVLYAYPSYETLAGKANVTERTLTRVVTKLRERKHIETTEGRGRSKSLRYHAIIKPVAVPDAVEEPAVMLDKTRHECPVIEKKPDIGDTKTGHLEAVKVDTNVLRTSLNNPLNNSLSDTRSNDPAFEPFKAGWSLVVFDWLSKGSGRLPRPATAFLRDQIEKQGNRAIYLEHQAKHGWPDINRMFERPTALDASSLASGVGKMALEVEPVTTGSALWAEWQSEFERRGWPFPREAKGMCFPHGGPRMLDAFMSALAARQAGSANVVTLAGKAMRYA
ncbi:helix-turn-helix domain-containing protein [Brucella pituitosa]|uniref:Helix-turn-helix domain-containing protein n=1 Tax=Brucella pituitosa TaxID=571256 RepID=A0ABS3JX93_9HYPH|nr:helix-turn-helix domain-containing protein [Brucella pituitosa]MBO1038196.1 helix-turn-helix domain-containing protein [Brucella pituitosa]